MNIVVWYYLIFFYIKNKSFDFFFWFFDLFILHCKWKIIYLYLHYSVSFFKYRRIERFTFHNSRERRLKDVISHFKNQSKPFTNFNRLDFYSFLQQWNCSLNNFVIESISWTCIYFALFMFKKWKKNHLNNLWRNYKRLCKLFF